MAKIIKVAPATHTPNVSNAFRTSRNSTTNPFKYSNFEGNTLQFADVFEGFEPKSKSKFKIIASSVAGSINKIKTGITEPIIHFVNRIGSGISSAWNYAKNTNISDVGAVKAFNNLMQTEISLPGSGAIKALNNLMQTEVSIPGLGAIEHSISGIKGKLSSGLGAFGSNILGIGDDINQKWAMVVSRFNTQKISSDMSVSDLEILWKNEIAAGEAGGNI